MLFSKWDLTQSVLLTLGHLDPGPAWLIWTLNSSLERTVKKSLISVTCLPLPKSRDCLRYPPGMGKKVKELMCNWFLCWIAGCSTAGKTWEEGIRVGRQESFWAQSELTGREGYERGDFHILPSHQRK